MDATGLTDATVWTAWTVSLALLERTARRGQLAPREPMEHRGLLVWLVLMAATVLPGSRVPQERLVLLVPLGLLAHRGRRARREPRGKMGPTGAMVSMDPQESAGPQPLSDKRA
jgi:hypothetical protein